MGSVFPNVVPTLSFPYTFAEITLQINSRSKMTASCSSRSHFKSGIIPDTEVAGKKQMTFQLISVIFSTLSDSKRPLD